MKIKISEKTRDTIKPILNEMCIEIKETNKIFTEKIIEGMTLCLTSILEDSKKMNLKTTGYKEMTTSLGNILYESILMKQDRKNYKKTKEEQVCRFFELTFGVLGQMVSTMEVEYYPFIKNPDTLEVGVKFFSEKISKYLTNKGRLLDETEKNIRI